jgi:hypothetical protein
MRPSSPALALALFLSAGALLCAEAAPVRQLLEAEDGLVTTLSSRRQLGTPPPQGKTGCFLNRFRSFTPSDAKNMGIKYYSQFQDVTVGSVTVQIVAMVGGVLLLFFGYKLIEYVLHMAGFAVGFIGCFWITSEIMTLAHADANSSTTCILLGIIPLVGGVVGVCLVKKLEKMVFFCYGGMVGLTVGHFVYVIGVSHLESAYKIDHSLCYDGTLVLFLILGGIVAVKLEDKILAVATSIVGSFCFSYGFWTLLTTSKAIKNPEWAAWVTPCMLNIKHQCIPSDPDGSLSMDDISTWVKPGSLPVVVPVAVAFVLAMLGLCVQLRMQRKSKDGMQPMPYGGHSAGSQVQGFKSSSFF